MTIIRGNWMPVFGILSFLLGHSATSYAEDVTLGKLRETTHIHGLAFDRADPSQILIATHHGFYRAGPDGAATLASESRDDFMGFTPDPGNAQSLYASGHPSSGGNLGFIASYDGGKTWTQLSPGADGPVDFHQLTVSAADPKVFYGAYGSLQTSRDGGRTWQVVGELPDRLIDLAASARDSAVIYAATETGLLVSRDGGRSWQEIIADAAVTVVDVTAEGIAHAFVYGRGLMRANEETLEFTPVGEEDFGGGYLLHLAVDPTNGQRLAAATEKGLILESRDGGTSWEPLGKDAQ